MDQTYIDFGYIIMIKQNENDSHVWYRFEIFMETGDYESDKKGRKTMLKKTLFGTFKFTKNENLLKEPNNYDLWASCISIKEADPIFSNTDKNNIMAKCSIIMGRCLENSNFPDRLIYAN
jgi:hypothetical protein